METILQGGINFILAFQALGSWLALPMKFFTFLGSEEFFLLVFPALYWSINASLGARIGAILLFTGGLNDMLKMAFHGPRPYWVSAQVKAMSVEPTFGVPSGHSQTAVVIWGMLASYIKRPWAWATAIVIILMIGLSRLYLGVHFPHDVLFGWLIGALTLWAFLRWSDPLLAWLKTQSLGKQIGLAFALSMLMLAGSSAAFLSLQGWVFPAEWATNALKAGAAQTLAPISLDNALTGAGTLFGFLAGLAWIASRGGFSTATQIKQRVVCYILGLVGLLILWYGLGLVFPKEATLVAYLLRYLRYTLVGSWITAGAPYLFLRFHLAGKAADSKLSEYTSNMR
ncbi:MAG: phosphatase PAP2 family protein [Anaerolineales bacterium]